MAYTPQLLAYQSRTLRRIAWAMEKPMTKTLRTILDNINILVDPQKVCKKCRDKSVCNECYFKNRKRVNITLPQPTDISTEVEMKVNQVSVLVSKKIGKNFCSWSVSYGATAEVEEEHFTEAISQLDTQLKKMVAIALPTPNGNGNHRTLQLSA